MVFYFLIFFSPKYHSYYFNKCVDFIGPHMITSEVEKKEITLVTMPLDISHDDLMGSPWRQHWWYNQVL